jgi:ferrochelatase
MKHWHPFIADTARQMYDDGVRDVVALALAPHYSRMSVGAYVHALEEANNALPSPFRLRIVDSWYQQPAFVALLAELVQNALERFSASARSSTAIVFTAHSLPVRIRDWGDRYEAELAQSCALVAQHAGIGEWRFAWQSAGGTHEPWLGPDVLEYLETLHRQAIRYVLQVPIGFVCEHLEVLYDIDVEAKEKALSLGMVLERTELPNASPAFVHALGTVVSQQWHSTDHAGETHV